MDMWTQSRNRESEMNWESRIDLYTLLCVKQIARVKLPYSTGSSVWCYVIASRGGVGRVEGRLEMEGTYVRMWLTHFIVQQK